MSIADGTFFQALDWPVEYWSKRIKVSVTHIGCCPEAFGSWTAY